MDSFVLSLYDREAGSSKKIYPTNMTTKVEGGWEGYGLSGWTTKKNNFFAASLINK